MRAHATFLSTKRLTRWIIGFGLAVEVFVASLDPVHATTTDDLVGTWDMLHDGWSGTLVIFPPDQHFNAVEGSCTFSYWKIDGNWTPANGGPARKAVGTFQGQDPNVQTNDPCRSSGHLVRFQIDFGTGDPPQLFTGYIFTQDNRHMAGLTWWHAIPFGWSAVKR
jgi:hypothetical protein